MAGLLDIAPISTKLHGVTVTGVSVKGVAYILDRFPQARMAMTGRELNLTVADIMVLAPQAIASIIAVGCGIVPDGTPEGEARQLEHEAAASELVVGIQMEFIDAILKATLPGGVGPFVKTLEQLGELAGGQFTPEAATNLPKGS